MPAPGPELRQRLAARIATARTHRSDRLPDFASSLPAERTTVVYDTNDANDLREIRPEISPRAGKGVQRMRVLLGTVAAALVVALLAGMLLTRMHAPLGQTTNDGHSNVLPTQGTCAPADITAHLPTNGDFGVLAMVSPNEGWALGSVTDPVSGMAMSSLILHYKNCTWTALPISYPGVGFSGISMGSATDGWAIGSTDSGAPFALHYTGGAWKSAPPPGKSVLGGGVYSQVHMLSADEGWITFNHPKDRQGNLTQGLLHLVNGRWSVVNTPFPGIDNILPVAPNDAWVLGDTTESQQVPDLYHYRAGTWTRTLPPSGIWVSTMRMVAPNYIWASGQRDQASSAATGATLHYDGSQWREVPVGASGRAQDVEAFDQGTSWAFTISVPTITKGATTPPPDPVIASAQYQRDGLWQQVSWPFTDISQIGSIIRVSADEYWAIGYRDVTNWTSNGNGSFTGAGYSVGVLLYFANGAWHEIPTH
jgi:hypothetical protein